MQFASNEGRCWLFLSIKTRHLASSVQHRRHQAAAAASLPPKAMMMMFCIDNKRLLCHLSPLPPPPYLSLSLSLSLRTLHQFAFHLLSLLVTFLSPLSPSLSLPLSLSLSPDSASVCLSFTLAPRHFPLSLLSLSLSLSLFLSPLSLSLDPSPVFLFIIFLSFPPSIVIPISLSNSAASGRLLPWIRISFLQLPTREPPIEPHSLDVVTSRDVIFMVRKYYVELSVFFLVLSVSAQTWIYI